MLFQTDWVVHWTIISKIEPSRYLGRLFLPWESWCFTVSGKPQIFFRNHLQCAVELGEYVKYSIVLIGHIFCKTQISTQFSNIRGRKNSTTRRSVVASNWSVKSVYPAFITVGPGWSVKSVYPAFITEASCVCVYVCVCQAQALLLWS